MNYKHFVPLGLLLLIISCRESNENTETMPSTTDITFDEFVNNYYEDGLKLDPVKATMAGDHSYNHLYTNSLSEAHREKVRRYYQFYQEEMERYPDTTLSESEQMSKAVLAWECNINLEHLTFKNDEYFPIDQMWSANLTMGQMASGAGAQPFEIKEDYEAWLRRLDGYLDWLQSAEKNFRKGMDEGYVLPKSLIVKILPQLKSMTEKELNKNLFYQPVLNMPGTISEEDQKKIAAAYRLKLNYDLIPAYESLYNFMANEYLPAGRSTSGIDAVPNGKAFYDHHIRLHTTTHMTADEIHELGLREVARIRSEMEKVKDSVDYEGDLKSFFEFVRVNKDLMPYNDPQQIIDNFNTIHERMKPQIEKLFDLRPKTSFEVRRTEAFREKSSSAEYNQGSLDGTRPGIFYVPIPDVTSYNVYGDESLFLHEAIPGHHYQISLTQESDLPTFRKTIWYSGYGEGWALYCESLGKELGLYTDPYQYFGMLGAEMHRAIRLVVDTGLHSKGWTREEAIQYSLDNEAESEANIVSEIERYMANPGQALSYKIGQIKIQELRAKAEKELGAAFDIREFHNQVLETGCVPLALLDDKINRWIQNNKN